MLISRMNAYRFENRFMMRYCYCPHSKQLRHLPSALSTVYISWRSLEVNGKTPKRFHITCHKDSLADVSLDPDNLDPIVGQVMNRDVIFLREKQTIRDAIQMFLSSGISGAPVLDKDGVLVGVLSETDIIRREAGVIDALQRASWTSNNLNLERLPLDLKKKPKSKLLLDTIVKDVMTKDPISISANMSIIQAAILMINSQVNRLPVVADGRVIGVLSRGDILQCMIWEILIAGSSTSEEQS